MARKPAPGTHDRILDIAAQLFYEHGVHAVGLQQIIDACGCGKNLLYREFPSKDELVIAYLERRSRIWTATIEQATQPLAGDPAAQLVAIVRAAAVQVADPGYRGCPFLNTLAEFPDPSHPVHQACVAHRAAYRAQLHAFAERAQARDAGTLADRIMLIIDGLYATGATLGSAGATATAVALAEEVVARR
jgi:AcrR family transcriptional regulator